VGQPGSKGIAGTFSPDDRYLAYSLTGDGGNSRSGLYLFNLGTGQTNRLYESPCADYDLFGEVCGGTGRPFWIDKDTLVFNGYSGAMPNSVEKSSTVEAPPPNRTFVMTVDGAILQEISPVLGGAKIEYQLGSGPTLFIGSDNSNYQEEWKWLETADLARGVIKANPISGFNIVPSPDGQFVIQRIDSLWHLTELRTGVDKQLKGEYMTKCLHAAWSTDGKYVACSTASSDGYHVMMISLEKGTIREIKEAQGYFLVTWMP
jgi:Tol biopolymer transport system component